VKSKDKDWSIQLIPLSVVLRINPLLPTAQPLVTVKKCRELISHSTLPFSKIQLLPELFVLRIEPLSPTIIPEVGELKYKSFKSSSV